LQIHNCEFPNDLYFDVENDIWVNKVSEKEVKLGFDVILSALAGRIKSVHFKEDIVSVKKGELIGTVESEKYFGPIRSPVTGRIIEFNSRIKKEPRLINDVPYYESWIARIQLAENIFPESLLLGNEAAGKIETRINELHIRCFKKVPDDELVAVGAECLTTLVNLGELLKDKPVGSVVHLVSDDPSSSTELERWAELTKNEIIEARDEGNLHHFMIEKKNPLQ
jgi:glycine cleavage system H protein